MSYCRFENTADDLQDCVYAIENGEMTVDMSDYEADALRDLLMHAESIVCMKREIEQALDRWQEHADELEREEYEHEA
jgi:exonuclease VII small subunit